MFYVIFDLYLLCSFPVSPAARGLISPLVTPCQKQIIEHRSNGWYILTVMRRQAMPVVLVNTEMPRRYTFR
jgi:hypothetical protein